MCSTRGTTRPRRVWCWCSDKGEGGAGAQATPATARLLVCRHRQADDSLSYRRPHRQRRCAGAESARFKWTCRKPASAFSTERPHRICRWRGIQASGAVLLLTALPDGLAVGGWLDVGECPLLAGLPPRLRVGKGLDASGCTGLRSLPDDLILSSLLDLRGCTSLVALPEGLVVGWYLDLKGARRSRHCRRGSSCRAT